MAQSIVINSVQYSDVPEIQIPKQGGGTASFYDTSGANIASSDVLTGKTAFGASGSVSGGMANNGDTSGTISTKAGTVVIPSGYTSGGTISISASAVQDLSSSTLLTGKTVLGVQGSLSMPSISQDGTTHVLSIS